jgi:hypothetical protein
MNWKRVRHLVNVDRKSGRLIRGQKLSRYAENRLLTYLIYSIAIALGLVVGIVAGLIYMQLGNVDVKLQASTYFGLENLLVSLPTIVLLYSLVFTTFQQIQRSGVSASSQPPYWLPITWEEHTLASILANLFGFPLASLFFITCAVLTVSIFICQGVLALATVVAVWAAAFMASALSESLRVLQVRFVGAVYKSTGRAAVWVRFVGSVLFFLLFYTAYFYVTQGSAALAFVQTLASTQNMLWFVPFMWLGIALYWVTRNALLLTLTFAGLSLLFIVGLFRLAVWFNRNFGLYEPPAITVSRAGYAPKAGWLERLGFSKPEAALFRKDFRAFTRRRELMAVFILPVVILIAPLMQSLNVSAEQMPYDSTLYLSALVFLMPPSVMAISLGNFMTGEEGQAVWRIYASPLTARSFVKSKYLFILFFSFIVSIITGAIGYVLLHPSLKATLTFSVTAIYLTVALGATSLSYGIKGADFTEAPRARMIRQSWALVNLAVCLLAAIAIMTPFFPYMVTQVMNISLGQLAQLWLGMLVSAVISLVITVLFLKISLKNAEELLSKAEI